MKDLTKKILKISAAVLAFALIISSIFIVRSCSAPPEYEEIRSRVEELIEASFDVNDVVWGEGLATYPRVTKPIWSYYKSDDEQQNEYYYYYVDGIKEKMLAFRKKDTKEVNFQYAYVASEPTDSTTLASLYPVFDGVSASEELYTEIYSDSAKNIYMYLVPYAEKAYEFYYISSDPTDYNYIVDSKYASVDAIKDYVRTVYASEYADSLDSILFDGVMEGEMVQKARYTAINSSRGTLFASLNTFEPLFTERRVYLYDTARIDRSNSNDTSVVVEIDSYLPSSPDKIVLAKICFVLQGDNWYLASPTY